MSTPAQELRRRFCPILSQYQISVELQNLRIRPGDFSGYLRKFNSLRSQLQTPWPAGFLQSHFTSGLTPEFERAVLYTQVTDLNAAVDQAMLFNQTNRMGTSSSRRYVLSDNARHVSFSPGRSRHGRSPSRSPHSPRTQSSSRSRSPHQRTPSSRRTTSPSPSQFPFHAVKCTFCGRTGHTFAVCFKRQAQRSHSPTSPR